MVHSICSPVIVLTKDFLPIRMKFHVAEGASNVPGGYFVPAYRGQKTGQQFRKPLGAVGHEQRFGDAAFRDAVRRSLLTECHVIARCTRGFDFLCDHEKIFGGFLAPSFMQFTTAKYTFCGSVGTADISDPLRYTSTVPVCTCNTRCVRTVRWVQPATLLCLLSIILYIYMFCLSFRHYRDATIRH
jgi:hypothetical protein